MQLILDADHFRTIVQEGICRARVSIDIMTADFKAMLVPDPRSSRRAKSVVQVFRKLADHGVEIRLLHAGIPSAAALVELKKELPDRMCVRRCPRLHSKTVIIDSAAMYLGSANLTGAGLGAKADGRRNFESGIWTTSPDLIDGMLNEFNQLWEGRFCKTCKRRDVCPVPLEEPDLNRAA
jgi:phosphatidylserine/phosphatidylglycerophosphate/cardiolipin synthase-like enzyme